MKTLGRRVDREPLNEPVSYAALVFLQQDAAELRERLGGRVVQRPEQVLPLRDVKREHAHRTRRM